MFDFSRKYGRLTPVHALGDGSRRVLCRCDCGTDSSVRRDHLVAGIVVSCGCRMREAQADIAKNSITHGHTKGRRTDKGYSRTYTTWKGLKGRKTKCYAHVTIDQRWASFQNFLEDMGVRPENTSIDRIDNAKGYTKSNCRWATSTQQARNRTITKLLTAYGITAPVAEWAEALELPYKTLVYRISSGWDPEDTVTYPTGTRRQVNK